MGAEGGSALAAILSQTKITDLKWASISNPGLIAFAFLSAPLNMHLACTLACSLYQNKLGPEGGAALAEGLKGNTTLTSLE